ncbi:MAG: plasmid pRiA4b ORF-3 family protein [Burkholderiales bacterium]|nr:plasmid pRiA4b ORF-3 family protein [Burkholderiales bacterium]
MAGARKTPTRAIKIASPIYQLRIELLDVTPVIWRRVLVPGSIKLHRLHGVLLWTMGWAGGHLHEFVIGYDHYGAPDPYFNEPPRLQPDNRFTLTAALGARKWFIYLYDYGDGWEHRVTVEQILPPDPTLKLPQCLDGANACPPEDVGGPPGYEDFLEAIRDPNHEEHDAMLEWCGGAFDPTAFDAAAVNESLRRFKI